MSEENGDPAAAGITGGAAAAAPPEDGGQDSSTQNQQQPAAPASGSFSFYGDDGPNAEVVGKLPPTLQKLVSKYKNDEGLDNGLKHLNYMASQKGFEPLPPDADEAAKARHSEILKNVLGVPDSIEGYGVEKPEGMSDEDWQKVGMDDYLEVMRKHNAPPSMVKELVELDRARGELAKQEAEKAHETQMRAEVERFQSKYGNETQKMFAAANQVADTFGLPRDQIKTVEQVEFLNNVAKAISEDKLTPADGLLDSPKSYLDQANAIMNDQSNPYYQDFHSGVPAREKRAQAERTRLINLSLKGGRK